MDEALRHFEEAKELYLVEEDWQGQAHCIHRIGEIEQHQGRMEKALTCFEEARQMYLMVEDIQGQLNCLFNISELYAGDPQSMFKAIAVVEEAVQLSKAAGNYYEARSTRWLAELLFLSCKYHLAGQKIILARQLFTDCLATSDVEACDHLLHKIGEAERLRTTCGCTGCGCSPLSRQCCQLS
ncbi:hypothetical protein BT69DRAFT_1276407 [Atractiella rhizophila]|nr:hypothetical protein BT69DRAFT_1276407 [Atractiella rhizophila]